MGYGIPSALIRQHDVDSSVAIVGYVAGCSGHSPADYELGGILRVALAAAGTWSGPCTAARSSWTSRSA